MSGIVTTGRRASGLLYSYARAIEPGVWLIPANSCPDVGATLIVAGHQIETIDLDKSDLLISRSLIKERIKRGAVKGLLVIATYGTPNNPNSSDSWVELRQIQPDLKIVWDRCLGYPMLGTKQLPDAADMIMFSTGRSKPLDLAGGGLALTRHPLKHFRREFQPEALHDWEETIRLHRASGSHLNTEAIASDWLDTRLLSIDYLNQIDNHLEDARAHRSALNEVYTSILPAKACLPEQFQQWRFNFLTNERDTLLKKLFSHGLWASGHYQDTSPLFGLPACPVAARLGKMIVNLFTDKTYNFELAELTAGHVREHLDKYGFPDWEWEKAA